MDEDFFKNLFYGNYRPAESLNVSPEVVTLIDKVENLKSNLTSKLDQDSINTLLQLDNAYTDMIDIFSVDSYSNGVRFVLNLFYNGFSSNNSKD